MENVRLFLEWNIKEFIIIIIIIEKFIYNHYYGYFIDYQHGWFLFIFWYFRVLFF